MNLPAALPRIVGAKLPLRPMHVWTIRVRLQIERRVRDLALFDIALDSKLRGCDVVALRLADIMAAGALKRRATIIQQKTGRPVQFEITEQTRRTLADWLRQRGGRGWKRFTAEEIADLVYIALRLLARSLRSDLAARDPMKADKATRKAAEAVAARLEGYPTFGPASASRAHSAGGGSDPGDVT